MIRTAFLTSILIALVAALTAAPAFADRDDRDDRKHARHDKDSFHVVLHAGSGYGGVTLGHGHGRWYPYPPGRSHRDRYRDDCRCGHWETIEKRVWVPGYHERVWVPPVTRTIHHPGYRDRCGRYIPGRTEVRVIREGYYRNEWHEGYYKTERERVWVPEPRCRHKRLHR